MEEFIRNGRDDEGKWVTARKQGKIGRRTLTDTIRDTLIPHAIGQGSTNYKMLYMVYTKMVNKILIEDHQIQFQKGDNVRNYLHAGNLGFLQKCEEKMSERIIKEVKNGEYYKEIFQSIKVWCQDVSEMLGPMKPELPGHNVFHLKSGATSIPRR